MPGLPGGNAIPEPGRREGHGFPKNRSIRSHVLSASVLRGLRIGVATEIQLGIDDYPILDQFSEEGFVDLTFEIVDLAEDDAFFRFHLASSFEGEVVGMGVVLRKGVGPGFDEDMDLIQENVYRQGVRFYSAGEQSDRLVRAIAKLYGYDAAARRMIAEEAFTAIALQQGEIDLAAHPVRLKIFGRDADPIDEDRYYESFFNVDIANRLVFWNEKDQDYRNALLAALTRSEGDSSQISAS